MDIRALNKNLHYASKVCKGFLDKYYYILILYKIIPEATINFNFNSRIKDVKLNLRNNNGSDTFILSEVFKDECYKLDPGVEEPYILDLGANAGFTAVYYSKLFPNARIACVEPIPNNINYLRKNLDYNQVRAHVFEAAIGIEDGTLEMEISEKDYGHKVSDANSSINASMIQVAALTIPSILQKLNWLTIDLLKIDIEGYEGILLSKNNSWLKSVNTIIMELHEGITIEEIKTCTAPYKFDFVKEKQGNWILSKFAIND